MSKLDFAAHRPQLHRFVRGIMGASEVCEDIVQEALLRAFKSPAVFSGRAQPDTWLAAIALNVLSDHYRASKPAMAEVPETILAELPAEGDDALLGMMKKEMDVCITGHLMALPERQRRALVLRDMAGASHAEVAKALGIGEGAARVVLHRARAALRERLQRHCHLDFGREETPCTPRSRSA